MTERSQPWVILDDRPVDPAAVAWATESQAPLGALIERLRNVHYPQLPVPPDGEEVTP